MSPADYDGFLTPIAIAEGEDLYVTLPAGLFYTSSGTKTVEIVLHYAATSGRRRCGGRVRPP